MFLGNKSLFNKLNIKKTLAIDSNGLDRQVVLLIWRAKKAVVMGVNQNPFLECNPQYCNKHGITLARRASGGGTVYHDPYNLNFSVIYPRAQESYGNQVLSREQNLQILVKVLNHYGFNAVVSDMLDVLCKESKVSGSAVQYTSSHVLHHFTLLLGVDESHLHKALAAPVSDAFSIETSAVASRRSTTSQLALQVSDVSGHYLRFFADKLGSNVPPIFNLQSLGRQDRSVLKRVRDHLASDVWIYGRTPRFVIKDKITSPKTAGAKATVFDLECAQGKFNTIQSSELDGYQRCVDITSQGMDNLIQLMTDRARQPNFSNDSADQGGDNIKLFRARQPNFSNDSVDQGGDNIKALGDFSRNKPSNSPDIDLKFLKELRYTYYGGLK